MMAKSLEEWAKETQVTLSNGEEKQVSQLNYWERLQVIYDYWLKEQEWQSKSQRQQE